MTQPPFQVDVLQLDPGSGDTLTVDRDPATHGMRFKDPSIPSGVLLSQLANLNTVTGVLTVGRGGSGATYSTLQAALNAVPTSSSATNPYVILVLPGTYTETLTWNKDGMTLLALGHVVIQPVSTAPVITITGAVGSTPLKATLQGVTVLQPQDGQPCVSLVGGAGSTVGSQGILFQDCTFKPTGIGGVTILASAVNNLILRNCRSDGASGSASMQISQCASLDVQGGLIPSLQVDFNSSGTIPSVSVGAYRFSQCESIGAILSTLQGGGSIAITTCVTGNVTINGNRTLVARGSTLGTLTVNGTSAVTLVGSTRGAASGAGTLQEDRLVGTSAFSTTDTVLVTFAVPRASASFLVLFDAGPLGPPWAVSKTVNGFTIQFSTPVSTTVDWVVIA